MHHSFNFKAFHLNLDFIFSNMILPAHLLILFANTSSYNSFVSKAKLNTIKTDLISWHARHFWITFILVLLKIHPITGRYKCNFVSFGIFLCLSYLEYSLFIYVILCVRYDMLIPVSDTLLIYHDFLTC